MHNQHQAMPNKKKVQNEATVNKPSFEDWYKTVPPEKNYMGDYNLRAAYDNLPYDKMVNFATTNSEHLPDTYKLPNHPTFSNESMYYQGTQSGVGGYWNGDNYVPNPQVGPPVEPIFKKGGMMCAQNGYIIPEQQVYAQQMYPQLQMGVQQPYPLPINENMQGQQIPQSQFPTLDYSADTQDNTNNQTDDSVYNKYKKYNKISGGIASGAKAIGGVLDTIGDIRRGIITGGSALLNALIPDNQTPRPKAIQYTNSQDPYGNQTYNNMYENGGTLSGNKAREILHDGTINGKKITDKQRKYFGWVSNGSKADSGATVTNYGFGEDIPNLTPIQRAVLYGNAAPTSVQDVTPINQPVPLPINNSGSQYGYYDQGQNGQFAVNIPRALQDRTALSGNIGDPYAFSTNRSFAYENQYGNRDYTPQQYQTSDYYGRVFQNGGIVNNSGYTDGSQTANNPMNIIPTNFITTQNMSQPINANGVQLEPNSGNYLFPTQSVVESQIYQEGKSYDLSEDEMKKLRDLGYEFE